jgi:hypothetical protein
MTIKKLELPLILAAQNIVHEKAQFIDNEYKLDIKELKAAEKYELMSQFMKITTNLDAYLQEFINDACMDRACAESNNMFGGWDE